MIKIINGKRYNTETAAHICQYGNDLGRGDFNAIDMQLYRTPKGKFFVVGWGGAATRYGVRCGNMRAGAVGLYLVDDEEALGIMEKADATSKIELYFDIEDA